MIDIVGIFASIMSHNISNIQSIPEGWHDGWAVGRPEGCIEGVDDGCVDGWDDGCIVGIDEGCTGGKPSLFPIKIIQDYFGEQTYRIINFFVFNKVMYIATWIHKRTLKCLC
jgi:hypothetical protein